MVGVYNYQNGLQFTGVVANTKEEAIKYLASEFYKNYERAEWETDEHFEKNVFKGVIKEVKLV